MESPILTFRLFKFNVEVHFTFLLLLLFVASGRGPVSSIGWVIAVFLGVLVHELGHAVVARRFGLRVDEIALQGLGGHVRYSPIPPHGRRLAIALAGPFAGFALGAAAFLLATALAPVPAAGILIQALAWPMWTVTLVYGIFNLIPAFPLDGGQALHSALTFVMTSRNARQFTAGIGMLLGLVGVWWALNQLVIEQPLTLLYQLWPVALFGWISWTNLQIVQGGHSPY